MLDEADREAKIVVDLAHPLGVALDQVVVDGDEVDALARDGVEGEREGGGLGLALTGLHFGDLAFVQGDRRP